MPDPLELGPWPLGEDNAHDRHDAVYMPSGDRPARLLEARNVDLDNQGYPTRRPGTTSVLSGTSFKPGIASKAGLLLVQDQGTIKRIIPGTPFTTQDLVTGLSTSAIVRFEEYANFVLWTNGETGGKILSNGTATHWGMGVPPTPTLGTTAGNLPAGRYRVAATYVDSDGAESGALKAAAIVVDGTTDITVNLSVGDSNATHLNFYVSTANQEKLFFCEKVAVGALPHTLTDMRITTRPLRTQHLRGPIWGTGLFTFLGFVLIYKDNYVFRSEGQTPNLFDPRHFMSFPWDVRHGIGLQSGFWVATEKSLHWISGEDPASWRNLGKAHRGSFAAGAFRADGKEIPRLETDAEVALFAGDDGLIAGLEGGRVVNLTDDRLLLNAAPAEMHMLYRKSDAIRQFLMLLT